MDEDTYYDVLEIDESASAAEIKVAYRKLAKEYHPDHLPQELLSRRVGKHAIEAFKLITEAYKVLGKSETRSEYDRLVRKLREQSPEPQDRHGRKEPPRQPEPPPRNQSPPRQSSARQQRSPRQSPPRPQSPPRQSSTWQSPPRQTPPGQSSPRRPQSPGTRPAAPRPTSHMASGRATASSQKNVNFWAALLGLLVAVYLLAVAAAAINDTVIDIFELDNRESMDYLGEIQLWSPTDDPVVDFFLNIVIFLLVASTVILYFFLRFATYMAALGIGLVVGAVFLATKFLIWLYNLSTGGAVLTVLILLWVAGAVAHAIREYFK